MLCSGCFLYNWEKSLSKFELTADFPCKGGLIFAWQLCAFLYARGGRGISKYLILQYAAWAYTSSSFALNSLGSHGGLHVVLDLVASCARLSSATSST